MRGLTAIVFTVMLSGCSGQQPGFPSHDGSVEGAASRSQKTHPSPEQLLESFYSDLRTCSSLARALKADQDFVSAFHAYANRKSRSLESFLRQSLVAQTTEGKYVLSNIKYFDIDVSMHGSTWAVAWVENTGIYCGPTLERLREIESLGESTAGWKVREFFLNKALENLNYPWIEADYGLDFDGMKTLLLQASARYVDRERHLFHTWLENAIAAIKSKYGHAVEGAAGLTVSKQHQVLDKWISFLRSLRNRTR